MNSLDHAQAKFELGIKCERAAWKIFLKECRDISEPLYDKAKALQKIISHKDGITLDLFQLYKVKLLEIEKIYTEMN
jgi:hypothetical protein